MNDYLEDLKAGGRPMTKKEIKIKELQTKIDKAIAYIKTCNDKEKLESMFLDESYISNYGAKELLEILGDKENE